MGNRPPVTIDTELFAQNVQKRYLFLHMNKMIELCYPVVAFSNQRLSEKELPLLVQCVNRLNAGVEYAQQVSDSLLEGSA